MPLARFLSMVLLCACGPSSVAGGSASGDGGGEVSERMIGTWSDRGPDSNATNGTVLQIHSDGTLARRHVSDCGGSVTGVTEYLWSAIDPTTIEVTDLDGTPMGDYRGDAVRFLFTHDECNGPPYLEWLSTQSIDDEVMNTAERVYVRGEICFTELPPPMPDEVESPSCKTDWCDGEPQEPPSCEAG